MRKLNGRFTTIPNNLITSTELSGSEFKVLCYLCMLSDNKNYSFPSYDKIHQEIGLATSTVKLAVKSLIKKNFLTKTNRKKLTGEFTSNSYVLSEKIVG